MSMAGLQAEPDIASWVFGGIVIRCTTTEGFASYDDLGQRFVFCPAPEDKSSTYAIDVERRGIGAPEVLQQELAAVGDEFYRRWTELEVLAKLYDVPVLALVKEPPFREGVLLQRVDTEKHWIVLGKRDPQEESRIR